jgi:hypothetical protein
MNETKYRPTEMNRKRDSSRHFTTTLCTFCPGVLSVSKAATVPAVKPQRARRLKPHVSGSPGGTGTPAIDQLGTVRR